jgi:hypothetical protein
MRGIRFFFPAGFGTLAAAGLAVVLSLVPWDGARTAHADPSSVAWEVTFDETSTTSFADHDGRLEEGESPDTITTVSLDTTPGPANESFFDLVDTVFEGFTPAYGAAVADGARTGTMSFSVESNLVAPLTSNVSSATGQPPKCAAGIASLSATFNIFDADLGTGTDADHGLGAGIISEQDLDGDGHRETEEDNFLAGGSPGHNGLADGIDLLPDALANYLIPSLGLGSPIARSFGVATVSAALGVTTDVNFLLYHLGGGEYLTLTILGYPGIPRQQPSAANLTSQTVITCPPFTSTVRLFGLTQDNPVGPPVAQRTAIADTHNYEILVSTGDNYDGDAAANPYDSCPAVVSVNTDLPAAKDPDNDRWDSACDPRPGSADNDGDASVGPYNLPVVGTFPLKPGNCNIAAVPAFTGGWECDQDVDGDTFLNTADNCPTVPDADVDNADEDGNPLTGIDWQLDSDADGVGDVCDPAPRIKGDGSGYAMDAYPHGFPGEPGGYGDHDRICNDQFTVPGTEGTSDAVCVDTVDSGNDGTPDFLDRDGDTAYDSGEPIDADSDADGDGYSDACEAVRGSDPLDASSIPAGSLPSRDCDGDGVSDEDEEALGLNLFVSDTDGEGCADGEELAGAPAPKPGSTGAYNPLAWYDFYDVPVPVRPDPQANGTRNKAINFQDVLTVLAYVGTYDGDGGVPNLNGVSYDSEKMGAGTKAGRDYDRSPSPPPSPPNDAGPPSGAVNFQDVLVVLGQIGLACSGAP